ncbi:MAG: hypothetical protein SGI92_15575, partial [Bryobacteraceae bacterium]|nr:hypothetical protein [Bryobacteraceae bacterium]
MICPVVTRIAAAAFAVFASSGMLMAQFSMTASSSPLNFSYATNQTLPIDLTTNITSQVTGFVNISVSDNLAGLVAVSPNTAFVSTSPTVLTVRLTNPSQATTQRSGELRVTSGTAGLSSLVIPINLYPGGVTGGTSALNASPSSVSMTYTPNTVGQVQFAVTLSSVYFGSLTPTLSFPLSQYMYVTPNPVSSQSTFTLYLNPQFAPTTTATSGTLTLTPTSTSSGLPTLTIPITISPFGASTSNILASPSSISFNSILLTQNVTLTSPVTTSLIASPSANLGNWITVPSLISSNGTFIIGLSNIQAFPNGTSGSITLSPVNAGTGLNPVTIPITITPGTASGALSANPTSLTFSYGIGTTNRIDQTLSTTSAFTTLLTASLTPSLASSISV